MNTKQTKLLTLLSDITKYETYDFEDHVEERLNKILTSYIEELDNSVIRIRCKKESIVLKELSKS